MPIYEYQCDACSEKHEILQNFSDAPVTECPKCHKASLKKLITAASFHLKGQGWYATDFKNKNKVIQKKNSPSKPNSTSVDTSDAPTPEEGNKLMSKDKTNRFPKNR